MELIFAINFGDSSPFLPARLFGWMALNNEDGDKGYKETIVCPTGSNRTYNPAPNQLREIMWVENWAGDFEESPYLKRIEINQRY